MAPFVGDFFFLNDKKQYIDEKRTKRFQVHQEYTKGNHMGTGKKTARKTAKKNLPAQAKTRQSYLHPIQDKKSTKEFVLSTLYKLAQDHELLKKVAFVL